MGKSEWMRLLLSVWLLVAFIWLWATRFDELAYHTWSKAQLVDIGDVVSFDRTSVPEQSFVSVTGVLGNKAATLRGLRAGSFRFGRYQVRHLLGSKIYIEYDEAKYHAQFNPFKRITVQGRLIPFGAGSELEKVRTFFKDYYGHKVDDNAMLVVVDETPRSQYIYVIAFLISAGLIIFSFIATIRMFLRARRESDGDDEHLTT